jgi:hypothetical protein
MIGEIGEEDQEPASRLPDGRESGAIVSGEKSMLDNESILLIGPCQIRAEKGEREPGAKPNSL